VPQTGSDCLLSLVRNSAVQVWIHQIHPFSRAPRSRAAEFRPGRRRFGPLSPERWPPVWFAPKSQLPSWRNSSWCALVSCPSAFQGMGRRGLLTAALLLCFLAVCSGRGESSYLLSSFLFIGSTMFYPNSRCSSLAFGGACCP